MNAHAEADGPLEGLFMGVGERRWETNLPNDKLPSDLPSINYKDRPDDLADVGYPDLPGKPDPDLPYKPDEPDDDDDVKQNNGS